MKTLMDIMKSSMTSLYESLLNTEKVLKKNDLNIFNNLYDNMDSPYNFKQEVNRIIEVLDLKRMGALSAGGRINVDHGGPGLYMAYHERHGLLYIGFIQDLNDIYDKDPKSMAIKFLLEPRRVLISKRPNMKELFIGFSVYKLPDMYKDVYIDFYKKKLKNIHESLLDDEDENS